MRETTSRKTQNDYTFQEAKDAATSKIATWARFVENIDTLQPNSGLLQWAIELRILEERICQDSVRCLSETEIKLVWDSAQMIIQARPELSNQLRHLWDLFDEIIKSYSVIGSSKPLEPQERISKLSVRIDVADRLAETIVGSAKQRTSDILAPSSLLLIYVVRTESIGYAIERQLRDIVESFRLQGKYDPIEMCSVNQKVQKGCDWRTDIRAIRDAVAHGHVKITLKDGSWEIEFYNTEEGYNFQKKFDKDEFIKFFDLSTLLYKMQLLLLQIVELLPILVTHLKQ